MAKSISKKTLLKDAFNDGSLPPEELGNYYEFVVKYRGYYIDGDENYQWAGPWRNDNLAATIDTMPFAQQGFQTGVRMGQG